MEIEKHTKICLIEINSRYKHINLANLYLRSIIIKNNLNCRIKRFTINQNIIEIIDDIITEKSSIISFSCYIWNSEIIHKILDFLNKYNPKIKIILGGPNISYSSDIWLKKHSNISWIIEGQGESGLDFLIKNKFELKNKIIHQPPFSINNIDFPYLDSDFPKLQNHYIYYESSRGCSFACSYCLSSRSDQKIEFRNTEISIKEIDFFIQKKIKIVKFVDRTFNANKKHSQTIWKYLIEKKPKTTFHFEVHPFLFSESDFDILKKAPPNLLQFEIGVQSTNSKTLKEINRNINWDDVKENVKKLINLKNIHTHLDLIIGLPFESLNSFKNSFSNVIELKPEYLQLGFLKILPGTMMKEKSDDYKNVFIKEPPYQILENKWIKYNEMKSLREFENVFQNSYNSEKFKYTMDYILKNINVFDFFTQTSIEYKNKTESYNKQWLFYAEIFLNITKKYFDKHYLHILDKLRFDWSFLSNCAKFPEILSHQNDHNLKETKNEIRKILIEEKIIPSLLSSSSFSKSILFSSVLYYEYYDAKYNIFININSLKYIWNFNEKLTLKNKIKIS